MSIMSTMSSLVICGSISSAIGIDCNLVYPATPYSVRLLIFDGIIHSVNSRLESAAIESDNVRMVFNLVVPRLARQPTYILLGR
ncbi:hypothetical protein F5B19DRAFT_442157 [Rostrohypoxylon terebratum]|nr:hypothetical protein F5B19DRAFT_442157 [Rostrohypoxylon terebratum]